MLRCIKRTPCVIQAVSISGEHTPISRAVYRGRELLPRMCAAAVGVLSRENFAYFDRTFSGNKLNRCQNEVSCPEKTVLHGEVTLSKMAEVVCGRATERLWTTYDRHQSMQGVQLNSLIRLCLGDPGFPAFVEEVEKELNKIKEETKASDSYQD